ncbi:MAG: hypothetical protein LBP87_01395 [Planctomycetaceae bacterium]|jgi:hypothetical protein|nr:hypothetical protein [Planctomycetaceae bacterium]
MKRYFIFLAVSVVICYFGNILSTACYGQLVKREGEYGYLREDILKTARAANFSAEQIKAVNALYDQYDKKWFEIDDELNRVLPNLPFTLDGKSGIRSIERIEWMRKKMGVLNRKFETDYKRIADWKSGKNPDEKQKPKQEKLQQEKPQQNQSQQNLPQQNQSQQNQSQQNQSQRKQSPQNQSPTSSVEEKLANAEEAFPNNPHDKLDKIPGMNLSATQKTQINKLRKQRQEQMSKTVAKIKIQKIRKSRISVRKIFGILKFIAYLFNYRIERHLTPQQIIVLRKYQGIPIEVDRLEDLLGGASPEEIFPSPNETGTKDWNDGKSAEETGERLTRTNWQTFDELKTLLNLNDDQLFVLEGLDAEAKAANTDAIEAINERTNITDADIRNICNQHAERFALVNNRIRSKMQRNQMEKFNVLQLLLLDALEFPEANMASFGLFELSAIPRGLAERLANFGLFESSDKNKKNLNAAMILFVQDKNNLKMITDSNSVSVEQQKNAQKTLEQKVKLQLSQSDIDKWEKIVAENKDLLNTIRKYKER